MIPQLDPAAMEQLFEAICGSDTTAPDEREATRAVYTILGGGQAVTPTGLAAKTNWDAERAAGFLGSLPNVEHDEHGDVIGFGGLTLRPTAHEITVDGEVRYAWCAWDTLFIPVALDRVVGVSSSCGETGQPVTLTVAPTGILECEPSDVVLSFVRPEAVQSEDLRTSFCEAVHYLADGAVAAHWTARSADRLALGLDEAFTLGRRLIVQRCGL